MKLTFTPNDFIRFIYNEVSLKEREQIKALILQDEEVAFEFHKLMDSVMELNDVQFEPSDSSIKIILEQSKKLFAEELHA